MKSALLDIEGKVAACTPVDIVGAGSRVDSSKMLITKSTSKQND